MYRPSEPLSLAISDFYRRLVLQLLRRITRANLDEFHVRTLSSVNKKLSTMSRDN